MTGCNEAWSIIESRQWSAWRGLPECSITLWRERFPMLSNDRGAGRLGMTLEPAEVRRLALPAYEHALQVWSRDGTVVMVSVEYPGDDDELRRLSGALGEPRVRLDWAQRTLIYEKAGRVFSDRGIALLDSADGGAILRVNLFGPGDAEVYASKLHHPAQVMRRLPVRR